MTIGKSVGAQITKQSAVRTTGNAAIAVCSIQQLRVILYDPGQVAMVRTIERIY